MDEWIRRDASPMHCRTVRAGVSLLTWCGGKRVHAGRRCADRKRAEHPCLAPTHVGDSIRKTRTLLVIEEAPIVSQIRQGPAEDAADKRRKRRALIGKKRYRFGRGVDVDWIGPTGIVLRRSIGQEKLVRIE